MPKDEKDTLGNRMKTYERLCVGERLMPLLPVVARLDGKTFSTWTKGLRKPYDIRLTDLMTEVTKRLVQETSALIGYTQSDEITLIWESTSYESDVYFSGRVAKMTSTLSARCSNYFNGLLPDYIPEKAELARKDLNRAAVFDCRVFNVPVRYEAVNALIWREIDATRNSVQGAAQANFIHKELQGKDRSALMDMLMLQKGINWNDYPAFFKRGTYVQRKTFSTPFSMDEIEKLPPNHMARKNPNLIVERQRVVVVDMPPLARVVNREAVVFEGVDPLVAEGVQKMKQEISDAFNNAIERID